MSRKILYSIVMVVVLLITGLYSCIAPANQPPVIQSIMIPNEAPPGFEGRIFCKAVDPDGHPLKFQWFSDNGTFKGEGNSVTWVSPDIPGNYAVGVKVTDIEGHEAINTANVKVTALYKTDIDPNPIITMQMPLFYGAMVSDQRIVRPLTTSEIECAVPLDFLSTYKYRWYCNGGKLPGVGIDDGQVSKIGWISPGVPGNYTVTVEITDNQGNMSIGSVYFEVKNPACCEGICK